MSPLTPPQAAPSWTEAPEVVRKLAKDYIERDKEILDKIASLPHSECKFKTVSLDSLADQAVLKALVGLCTLHASYMMLVDAHVPAVGPSSP